MSSPISYQISPSQTWTPPGGARYVGIFHEGTADATYPTERYTTWSSITFVGDLVAWTGIFDMDDFVCSCFLLSKVEKRKLFVHIPLALSEVKHVNVGAFFICKKDIAEILELRSIFWLNGIVASQHVTQKIVFARRNQ